MFLTRYVVDPWTWVDCKLGSFLFKFGKHYSSMLLVLMSLEKCFAVYFPLRFKTVCIVKTAKWVTGVCGIILVGCNLVYLFVLKSSFIKLPGYNNCEALDISWVALETIDSVLYSFGPFLLMSMTNSAIAFRFMTAKRNHSSSTESTNQALAKSATRGTAMVVTVSVMFLILTAPAAIHSASYKWFALAYTSPFYRAFMNLTMYLNHSINGVLYCIVGSRFRGEIFKVIGRKEKLENSCTMSSCNNTTSST